MLSAEGVDGAIAHVPLTVALYATVVKPDVAFCANDPEPRPGVLLRMSQHKTRFSRADQIHRGKTPIRRHYLPERAEARGLSQADIARELGVEKSTVSRWFAGTIPDDKNLDRLEALLQSEPGDLFRDPHDDWMTRFLRGRAQDELDRIRATLEAAFPIGRTGSRG